MRKATINIEECSSLCPFYEKRSVVWNENLQRESVYFNCRLTCNLGERSLRATPEFPSWCPAIEENEK